MTQPLDEHRQDPQQVVAEMLRNGFSLSAIAERLGENLQSNAVADLPAPEEISEQVPAPVISCDHAAIANPPMLRRADPRIVRVPVDQVQLYTIDDFLSDAECDAIVGLIDSRLRPSIISSSTSDRYFRTSRSCELANMDDAVVAALDEKIAKTLGIHLPYSDGIEAQRYDVGQQFKPHWDYFTPGTPEYWHYCAVEGNRTWTFMIYLNDGMTGGGTYFPNIGLRFEPLKGRAVIWNNLRSDGSLNTDTMHCGEPVLCGHKTIITKWFREKGDGPMFYEQPIP